MENPEISESVEAMEALDLDLLMAVRDTGAKNVKEISWERVLQALPGNQLTFLKSRLKTLTKQPSEEAPTLTDKVNLALTNLSLGKSVSGKENPGWSKAKMKAAQEKNAGLLEYYEYLMECNEDEDQPLDRPIHMGDGELHHVQDIPGRAPAPQEQELLLEPMQQEELQQEPDQLEEQEEEQGLPEVMTGPKKRRRPPREQWFL